MNFNLFVFFFVFSYFETYTDEGYCGTARRGSDCVADSTELDICCVSDSKYADYETTMALVYGLGLTSGFFGFCGLIGILIIYTQRILRVKYKRSKGKLTKTEDANRKKMNEFRKMEIVTITCTVLATACDLATVILVISSNVKDKFQTWSVSGCYTTDAALKLSEVSGLFAQILILGWLEVSFDFFDIMLSLFFLNDAYKTNAELRQQLNQAISAQVETANKLDKAMTQLNVHTNGNINGDGDGDPDIDVDDSTQVMKLKII